jgi:hypothetical protein
MDKETLEEAAENYWAKQPYNEDAFIEGAKWQQERMYSEKEVKKILDVTLIEYSDFVLADIPKWFKQFKKK